jgi:DUF4097 and DUF4098 domain-containing protein YvlB
MMKQLIWATLLLAASTAGTAQETRTFDRTVPAEARGVVEISNVSGRIRVTGWDRNEVAVHATLEENVERVDVTSSQGRTIVKVVLPSRQRFHDDCDADLEVRVPSQSEVVASAVSADLETTRITGAQRLNTVSGELSADLGTPSFEAKTVSGNMRLRGSGQSTDIRVSTVSGDLVVERGGGDIDATTVSGDVELEMNAASDVRLRSTSGDLELRGSLKDDAVIEAATVSGDVTLLARAEGGLAYEVSSFSGDIENCFGKESERVNRHGPGSRLEGSTGKGKVRLRVSSMSGSVEICDH